MILWLHNIRSIFNVGSILRTAEGLGVKEVWCSGYTPSILRPELLPHQKEKLKNQLHKTALGAEEFMKTGFVATPEDAWLKLKAEGYQLVGLENNVTQKTYSLGDEKNKELIGDKLVLVVGEEVSGIDRELLRRLDVVLEIPMRGRKESFNVAIATAIALWELTKN